MSAAPLNHVWVVEGYGIMALFTKWKDADEWIRSNRLTALLTPYPLDEGTFDWGLRTGCHGLAQATLDQKMKMMPEFLPTYSPGAVYHCHYEEGECMGNSLEDDELKYY